MECFFDEESSMRLESSFHEAQYASKLTMQFALLQNAANQSTPVVGSVAYRSLPHPGMA